jgi:hypothetical protein
VGGEHLADKRTVAHLPLRLGACHRRRMIFGVQHYVTQFVDDGPVGRDLVLGHSSLPCHHSEQILIVSIEFGFHRHLESLDRISISNIAAFSYCFDYSFRAW